MLKLSLSAGLLAMIVQATSAKDVTILIPPDMTSCNTEGWATDRDPNGLNVRAAPSAKAPVIAHFKFRADVENATNVQFDIKGFKDGWLLIEGGTYGDYGDPQPKEPVY